MKDNTTTFLIKFVSLIALLMSCGIIVYINIILTFSYLFPELDLIKVISSKVPDLRYLTSIAIISSLIGWLGKLKLNEVRFTSPLELPKKDFFILLVISFSLTHYYIRSFSFLSYNLISFSFIMLLLLVITTQVSQLTSQLSKKQVKHYLSDLIMVNERSNNFILKLFSVIIISFGTIILFSRILQFNKYEKLFNNSFIISDIIPEKTTFAHKVSIKGYNFGPVKTDDFVLYSKYGPVDYQSWTNNQIDFIIPLHWKAGSIKLWIEKPATIEKNTIAESNTVSFILLPRWDFYPTIHDNIIVRGVKKFLRLVYLD